MLIELAPNLSLLAIMAIFLLNYLVVRKFFLQPINQVLVTRETETRSAEELYEASLAKYNDAATAMEVQLQNAKRGATQVREGFRAQAATHRQQTLERTGGEARQIVTAAESRLQADVEVARKTIVTESESLARLAAERILGRAV